MRILAAVVATATLALVGCGSDDDGNPTSQAKDLCGTYCAEFESLEGQTCMGAVMDCAAYLERKTAVVDRVAADLREADGDTADALHEVDRYADSLRTFNAKCSPVPDDSVGGATCAIRGVTVEANFRNLHDYLRTISLNG